jgi:hypothetical protein
MPLPSRLAAAGVFSVLWPTRFARIRLGQWRRRLQGRPYDTRVLAAERAAR